MSVNIYDKSKDELVRIAGKGKDGSSTANKVSYDNSSSNLSSTNVQGAIDEVNTKLSKIDSWHMYGGSIEENTVNTIDTDETITFHGIDTSKAYELWFDTSDGKQASVKSSELISQSDGTYNLNYVVNTPTAQTKFRLLVKGI